MSSVLALIDERKYHALSESKLDDTLYALPDVTNDQALNDFLKCIVEYRQKNDLKQIEVKLKEFYKHTIIGDKGRKRMFSYFNFVFPLLCELLELNKDQE